MSDERKLDPRSLRLMAAAQSMRAEAVKMKQKAEMPLVVPVSGSMASVPDLRKGVRLREAEARFLRDKAAELEALADAAEDGALEVANARPHEAWRVVNCLLDTVLVGGLRKKLEGRVKSFLFDAPLGEDCVCPACEAILVSAEDGAIGGCSLCECSGKVPEDVGRLWKDLNVLLAEVLAPIDARSTLLRLHEAAAAALRGGVDSAVLEEARAAAETLLEGWVSRAEMAAHEEETPLRKLKAEAPAAEPKAQA